MEGVSKPINPKKEEWNEMIKNTLHAHQKNFIKIIKHPLSTFASQLSIKHLK